MSIIATALKHLIAAGVTGDDLVRAVAEMEAELTPAQPTRSKSALRQERYRERHKASQSVTNVTCDESDVPPNEYISNPPVPQIAKAIPSPLAVTAERIVAAWNEAIPGTPLPQARSLNAGRLKHLKARLAEHSEADVILAIGGMVGSDWHSGRSGKWTEGSLGWLLKSSENLDKMLEKVGSAKPTKPALSAEEYRASCLRTAEIMEATGKTLDAEEWRKKASAVRPDRPPGNARPIGDLVSGIMQGAA